MQNGPVRYDADRLASLSFNPLLHNIRTNLARSFDLDPDTNLRDLFSDDCEYFIEDQFNDMVSSEDSHICDSFSLLHLNIRSLQCNASKLTDLLSNVNLKFSLIGISETWLNDSSSSVDIDGYSFVHKSRENRSGGGVGLYVSSNLNFKFRCDLDFSLPNVAESLFIEIVKPQGKNIVAGVIYRPPNQNVDEFLTMTNELLSKLDIANRFCSYFSNIGPNLAKEIHSSVSHRSFLSGHFCQSVFFDPVTPNELLEISNAFRPGKAAGHDRIPISIIKKSIQIIAVPLAHIINLSISRPYENCSRDTTL